MEVTKHRHVTFEYELAAEDGTVLDKNREGDPIAYVHGTQTMMPGLERALEGRKKGEEFRAKVAPEQGYGLRDERLVQSVPRDKFDPNAEVQPDMFVSVRTEQGDLRVRVVDVGPDEVTLDANHPLAGETLVFDVKVVDVRDATETEVERAATRGD